MPTEPEELTVQEHTAEPDKEEENPEVPEEDCVEYELLCKRLVHDAKWLRGLKKSDAHLHLGLRAAAAAREPRGPAYLGGYACPEPPSLPTASHSPFRLLGLFAP